MRVLAFFEHAVSVIILSIIVFTIFMSLANCIAPVSKEAQAAKMEPTMAIYRTFYLNPTTLINHNDLQEASARAEYEARARGGK